MKSKFSYIVIINVTDSDKRLFLTLKMTTAGFVQINYLVNNPIIRNIYWEIVTILTSSANYAFICAIARFDRNLENKSNVIKLVTVSVIDHCDFSFIMKK